MSFEPAMLADMAVQVVQSAAFGYLALALLSLGVAQNLTLLSMLPVAWKELRHQGQLRELESTWQMITSQNMPSVAVVVPAYNEEQAIVDVVTSMLALRYSPLEIIVVNDGSKDGTLQRLIDAFGLEPHERAYMSVAPCAPIRRLYACSAHPALVVVDKEPGGCKADASNAGINVARHDLVCVIDADSFLEEDSLARVVRPFLEDDRTVASGGTIRILNGCEVYGSRVRRQLLPKEFLPLMQVMEYQRAFLGARLALSRWGMLTIISGAFSVFRRDVTLACGGFSLDTVGEDYDLVMKMHHHLRRLGTPYAMRYLADTVCWTEAPADWRSLGTQRRRWQLGGLQVFAKHRAMCLNPRYGRIGMAAMPLALLQDVLGPIGELLGMFALVAMMVVGSVSLYAGLVLTAVIIALGVACTYTTLLLDARYSRWQLDTASRLKLLWAAVIENLGYRQINSFWRLQAGWMFLRRQSSWGTIKRMKR